MFWGGEGGGRLERRLCETTPRFPYSRLLVKSFCPFAMQSWRQAAYACGVRRRTGAAVLAFRSDALSAMDNDGHLLPQSFREVRCEAWAFSPLRATPREQGGRRL